MKPNIFNQFRDLIRQNQKAVVFFVCLAISAVFWLFNSLGREYETSEIIPVSYTNIPFSMELDRSLPAAIEYQYRGTGFELFYLYLRTGPDSITVDIGNNSANGKTFSINALNLANQLKTETKPYKAIPEIIGSGLITKNSKKIPVLASSNISYRQRFNATSPLVLVPDSVTVSGPPNLTKSINSIKTEQILLQDVHQEIFSSIMLDKNLPDGITLSDRYVYYYQHVSEFTEGEFEIPVELPPSQRGKITLVPSSVRIRFTADLASFSKIRASDFQAFTSVPFPETPTLLQVQLKRRPRGITNVAVEPEMINYLIKE